MLTAAWMQPMPATRPFNETVGLPPRASSPFRLVPLLCAWPPGSLLPPHAVPALGFPPRVVWMGLHVLPGEGVVCPRISAQYKRGEVTVIQEVIGLFIRKMLIPTFSAL